MKLNSFFSTKIIGRIIAAFCTILGFALISTGLEAFLYQIVNYEGSVVIFFSVCIACGILSLFASYKMWNGVLEGNLDKLQPMIVTQCIGIAFSLYPMVVWVTFDYLYFFLPFLITLLVVTLIVFVKIENKILTALAGEFENQNSKRISCGLRMECFGRFIAMIFVNVGSGGALVAGTNCFNFIGEPRWVGITDLENAMMACYVIYGILAIFAGWALWTGISQRNSRRFFFMLVIEFFGLILLIPSYFTNYQHSNVLGATFTLMIVSFFYTYHLYHLAKQNKLRKNQREYFFNQQKVYKIII